MMCIRPGLDLHHEEHVQALEEHSIDVQEIARQDPDAWEVRVCCQVGGIPAWRGCEPGCGQDRRIVPGTMRYPRPRSSPWMRRCPTAGVQWGSGGPLVLEQASVPGEQGAGCHDPVQPKVPGATAAPRRRSPHGRPIPVSGGQPDGAGPRPHAAAPRSRRPSRCRSGRAAPPSRTTGPSASRGGGRA